MPTGLRGYFIFSLNGGDKHAIPTTRHKLASHKLRASDQSEIKNAPSLREAGVCLVGVLTLNSNYVRVIQYAF